LETHGKNPKLRLQTNNKYSRKVFSKDQENTVGKSLGCATWVKRSTSQLWSLTYLHFLIHNMVVILIKPASQGYFEN
jgi:hypothetical protein